jgi:hypothetical protein
LRVPSPHTRFFFDDQKKSFVAAPVGKLVFDHQRTATQRDIATAIMADPNNNIESILAALG